MDHDGNGFTSRGLLPQRRPLRDVSDLLALINGMLTSVGSVYVTSQLVPITVIAGVAALLLNGLIIIKR